MTDFRSFRDVLDLWPSREALADELSVRASAVSKWWQRDNIPAERWSSILSTRMAHEGGVSCEVLADLAARKVEART